MDKQIVEKIDKAEMILVGIGEEFEDYKLLKSKEEYKDRERQIKENCPWALPLLNQYYLKEYHSKVYQAMDNLAQLLENRNYFVVSITTNDIVWESSLNPERIVTPCGGARNLQCVQGCESSLRENTQMEKELLYQKIGNQKWQQLQVGKCPECSKDMVLNNIYAENYMENGYKEQWETYTKWLQGTLNRTLCILELGVGMQYPSVIRWPFEKIAYFNQKATFIRINERLYQMTEELHGKGISVAQNAMDWLL